MNNETGSYILKTAIYNSTDSVPVSVSFDGISAGATANLAVLTAPDAYSYNNIGSDVVQSNTSTLTASAGGVFSFSLPALSVSVLEVSGNCTSVGRVKKAIPNGYKEIAF